MKVARSGSAMLLCVTAAWIGGTCLHGNAIAADVAAQKTTVADMDKARMDAAIARAELYPELASADFTFSEVKGLETTSKIVRHDNSNIMKIAGKYHVWYTRYRNQDDWNDVQKSIHTVPNYSKVWLAVSEDGWNWTETVDVLEDSQPGSWHECCKHAPYVIRVNDKFYMFYTARCGPSVWNKRVGLAVADNPVGPFKHYGNSPLLGATAESKVFDTIGQDDPCVLKRDGKYWLYFKAYGFDPKAQKELYNVICLAFADAPCGPYKRWEDNPLTRSHADYLWSHTGCLWPHRQGVAMISDNWQQSIRYSDDGITFHDASKVQSTPDNQRMKVAFEVRKGHAVSDPGVYCPELTSKEHGSGIRWGLSQLYEPIPSGRSTDVPFIVRFDCDLEVSGTHKDSE